MTWNQFVIAQLIDRLMWPQDAEKVLDLMKASPITENMKNRWNDSIEEYPPQMKSVILMTACKTALDWIDNNQPNAFYRSMFTGDEQ